MKAFIVAVCLFASTNATFLKRDDLSDDQIEEIERKLNGMQPYQLWNLAHEKTERGKFCVGEFTCGSSSCISLDKLCDGADDCGNGLDEPKRCKKCKDKAEPFACFLDNWKCIEAADKCGEDCPKTAAKLTEWGMCGKREETNKLAQRLLDLLKKMDN